MLGAFFDLIPAVTYVPTHLPVGTGTRTRQPPARSIVRNVYSPENEITMSYLKNRVILAVVLGCISSTPGFAQDRAFDWLPANVETVRLDPANYHTGRTYHPDGPGQNNHVDIRSERPVTVFMAPEGAWNAVLARPETIGQLRQFCVRENVTNITYTCEMPPEPMTLVVQDDRPGTAPGVFAGIGAVLERYEKTPPAVAAGIAAILTSQAPPQRHFVSPNDVHIQYYRWDCVENCIQPEFQWVSQVKEKYNLSSFLKIYGGFSPDHDPTQVSIKIKAPVPMLVAMLPSSVANQLHARPEMLEAALEKNSCQQRGVQSLQFECKFDLSDGPQSLIVVPEDSAKVPKKKTEIEMWAWKCTANCEMLKAENN